MAAEVTEQQLGELRWLVVRGSAGEAFTSLGAEPPGGVRSEPHDDSTAMTVCTFVADLTSGAATIAGRGAEPVTLPLAELAHGGPRAV